MEYFGQDIIEDEHESVNDKNNVHYFLRNFFRSSTISTRAVGRIGDIGSVSDRRTSRTLGDLL